MRLLVSYELQYTTSMQLAVHCNIRVQGVIIDFMRSRKLQLANDDFTIVDSDDYSRIMRLGPWRKCDNGYAVRRYHKKTLRLHRFIMGTPDGLQTDHINGNRLDNRKSNLRIVDANINTHNGMAGETKSVYKILPKYVTYDRIRDKYMASKVTRKRFDTLQEAVDFVTVK